MRHLASIFLLAILALNFSCSSLHSDQVHQVEQSKKRNVAPVRDWNRFPAIVERQTKQEVIALGDVHGGYERLVHLLLTAGLIKSDQQAIVGYSWSGGNRVLVCTGDLIDKGNRSLPVIDLMRALEAQAPAAG